MVVMKRQLVCSSCEEEIKPPGNVGQCRDGHPICQQCSKEAGDISVEQVTERFEDLQVCLTSDKEGNVGDGKCVNQMFRLKNQCPKCNLPIVQTNKTLGKLVEKLYAAKINS